MGGVFKQWEGLGLYQRGWRPLFLPEFLRVPLILWFFLLLQPLCCQSHQSWLERLRLALSSCSHPTIPGISVIWNTFLGCVLCIYSGYTPSVSYLLLHAMGIVLNVEVGFLLFLTVSSVLVAFWPPNLVPPRMMILNLTGILSILHSEFQIFGVHYMQILQRALVLFWGSPSLSLQIDHLLPGAVGIVSAPRVSGCK